MLWREEHVLAFLLPTQARSLEAALLLLRMWMRLRGLLLLLLDNAGKRSSFLTPLWHHLACRGSVPVCFLPS